MTIGSEGVVAMMCRTPASFVLSEVEGRWQIGRARRPSTTHLRCSAQDERFCCDAHSHRRGLVQTVRRNSLVNAWRPFMMPAVMKLGPSGLALAAAAATFGVSMAIAQSAPPSAPPSLAPAGRPSLSFANPPHKNLKVFPQDISGPNLISNMKGFAQALGVRCTYCHVGEEGKP